MASQADIFPRFSFGKTVSDIFAVIGRNWLVLAGLAVLVYGLPTAIFMIVVMDNIMSLIPAASNVADPSDFFQRWLGNFGPAMALGWIVTILLSVYAQGAMLSVVLENLKENRVTFGEALGAGLRHFFPVLGVTILIYILMAGAMLLPLLAGFGLTAIGASPFLWFLLIVFVALPLFIFVAISFLAAVPAVIAEPVGVIGALGRSWELASGHRWKLLAMIIIYGVVAMIVSSALSSATMPFMMMGDVDPNNPFAGMAPIMAIQTLLGSLVLVLTYPAIGATYYNLRIAKEGIPQDSVTDIFE